MDNIIKIVKQQDPQYPDPEKTEKKRKKLEEDNFMDHELNAMMRKIKYDGKEILHLSSEMAIPEEKFKE
ncbi:MAG: hypothetical protein ACNS60_14965 [Candidatus Cyclobacteriaceae bacterium M2_1C_046]